uniref:Ubiquitin-like domain-containing protein n=1 Tax=Alexandrium monilatum TaxID=311494 RepID=A0A7S4RLI8_9DINO|mmetsp:Transcript_73297/g.231481  ORF Transcript_73297/g.231481 Transcript_73297/m.231481 type:complete len:107 (+) Transcript_73297:76-396(+)
MKVTIRAASGPFDLDVSDSDTVADLLKKAMEKHKVPKWADGVQLTAEGQAEDLAEDGSKALSSVGVSAGASLKMAYYQDVLPSEAKKLKLQGICPGTAMPFLAEKA